MMRTKDYGVALFERRLKKSVIFAISALAGQISSLLL